jgi:sugar/nucleoside kinase (ribokinase family)
MLTINNKIACIGSLSKDTIVIKKQNILREQIGGVVYYSAIALVNLGSEVTIFPALAEKDKELLNVFEKYNINICPIYNKNTTTYKNTFENSNLDKCQHELISAASPYSCSKNFDILDNFNYVHLGPLSKKEMPIDFISSIYEKNKNLCLDIQGYLREGDISLEFIKNLLKYIKIIKTNEHEIKKILPKTSTEEGLRILANFGPEEVIITKGSLGSIIYKDGKIYNINAIRPNKIIDTTGCGDTFMAAYLFKRANNASLLDSANFASLISSKKIEYFGAYQNGPND